MTPEWSDQPGNRLLVALSHFAGVLPLFGILVPAGVYFANLRTNPPVARQALHAVAAQALFLAALLALPCLGVLLAAGIAPLVPKLSCLLVFLSQVFAAILLLAAWMVFPFAALRSYTRGEFTYPLIGTALGRPDSNAITEK